jgi:hypothetical protein
MTAHYPQALKDQIFAMYANVPSEITEDLYEAVVWAKETLTKFEGEGHIIDVGVHEDGVSCSFAKPQWSGDHSSDAFESGAEAVVFSVCDYICSEKFLNGR